MEQCGEIIQNAVITYPAYYTKEMKDDLIEVCRPLNFDCQSLVMEPIAIAAGQAQRLSESMDLSEEKTLMLVDLGGNSIGINILKVNSDQIIDVVMTNHTNESGGE